LFYNNCYFIILIFVFLLWIKTNWISDMENVNISGLRHMSIMFATSLKIWQIRQKLYKGAKTNWN
jgi:hypothetical protein